MRGTTGRRDDSNRPVTPRSGRTGGTGRTFSEPTAEPVLRDPLNQDAPAPLTRVVEVFELTTPDFR